MASNPENLEQFYGEYREYVERVLQPNLAALRQILNKWRDSETWADPDDEPDRLPDPSPLQRPPKTRIKRPEKVADKIVRKRDLPRYAAGFERQSFEAMDDVIGARIVVYFLNQLPLIDRQIRGEDSPFEVSTDDPPVAYLPREMVVRLGLGDLDVDRKDTGYASIHYVVRLKDGTANLQERPWLEIQTRTLAQDLWAEIEHTVGYKPDRRTAFPVTRYFQSMGTQIQALDDQLDLLSRELTRHQMEVTFKDDSTLNPENLPAVLSSLQIESAQYQVSYMLGILRSWGIFSVGDLRTLYGKWGELVRNKCRAVLKREATAVHVVALLALVKDARSSDEAGRTVEVQLRTKDWWDTIVLGQHKERGEE